MTTPQDYALEPCPFCGSKAHFEIDDQRWEWIECESCAMQGNRSASLMEDCKPKLAEAWNRRAPQSGWLPISEAPKDGTPIILAREASDEDDLGEFVAQGRWHEEDHDGPDNMGHDAGFMDDQFDFFQCARSFGNPAYRSKGIQPTHYMPLPLPPSTKGEPHAN